MRSGDQVGGHAYSEPENDEEADEEEYSKPPPSRRADVVFWVGGGLQVFVVVELVFFVEVELGERIS